MPRKISTEKRILGFCIDQEVTKTKGTKDPFIQTVFLGYSQVADDGSPEVEVIERHDVSGIALRKLQHFLILEAHTGLHIAQ